MTTSIKFTVDKGIEYIQITSKGFRGKTVFIGSFLYTQINEWLESENAETIFESEGVNITFSETEGKNPALIISEHGKTVTLESKEEILQLHQFIQEGITRLPAPTARISLTKAPELDTIVPEHHTEPKPEQTKPPTIEIYTPVIATVHRSITTTCPNCNTTLDLSLHKETLSGKGAFCPFCHVLLILADS